MAKQLLHAAPANSPPAPAGARLFFGMRFRDIDGVIEHRGRAFSASEKFWGYEADGAAVYSIGNDLAFMPPAGDAYSLRYVAGQGWRNSDAVVRDALANLSPFDRQGRFGRIVTDLFAVHDSVQWEPSSFAPYPGLKLEAAGTAVVHGQTLTVGGSPVELPGGYFVSQSGRTVQVADALRVCDRYRFVEDAWERLVERRRVAWSDLAPGAFGSAQGAVTLATTNVPPLSMPGGAPFTVHFAGDRTLCRYQQDGVILALHPTAELQEFVVEGRKLWRIAGARDCWSLEPAGVPGGDAEKPVLSKEVLPGLTIYRNGKLEVANRMFLGGEPIDVRFGHVWVHREAGVNEPCFLSASGVVSGVVFTAPGDWYKLTPVSPDQRRFAWSRLFGEQNPVDVWNAHADRVIDEMPPFRTAGLIVAALWRFVLAADKEPAMAPLGVVILALYFLVHILRIALLALAAPVHVIWKAFRRLRRSLELNALAPGGE
jgi:hypothetical protein